MAYCTTRTDGIWNFFGGCNQSICKAFVNLQISRAPASTALSVMYDHPMVSSTDDPTVVKANRFLEIAVEYGQLGNYLVDEMYPVVSGELEKTCGRTARRIL